MTQDQRRQVQDAILELDMPKPQVKNPLAIDETQHSEREGEYERRMVLAALRAASEPKVKE